MKLSLAAKPTARESAVVVDQPLRESDEIVLLNMKVTFEQRKQLQQIALNLDMTVKGVIFKALEEFKQKRGIL